METMQSRGNELPFETQNVAFFFGAVTMMSGIIGVPLGMLLSTKLKPKYPRADPIICATGLLVSAVFISLGMFFCHVNVIVAFVLLFIGEIALNLNWSIVADMLLYVVVPTCRSTAEAVQILASHALGDAGSPYLIGLVSDGLFGFLSAEVNICPPPLTTTTVATTTEYSTEATTTQDPTIQIEFNVTLSDTESCTPSVGYSYTSLQYAFFINCGVEVIGGILFLFTAIYIVRDKLACENSVSGNRSEKVMMKPYSPQDSLEELDDEEMIPQLKLICDSSEGSSSRSPSPEAV